MSDNLSNVRVCKCCHKSKSFELFEKGRSQCKQCRSELAKERRELKKKEDIVAYKCYEMSSSAYSRVFAKSKQHKKCYQNIVNPFGFSGIKEMSAFLYKNFYNDVKELLDDNRIPSVDRIDSNYGYTSDNIRIIEHCENTAYGVNNRKRKVKVTDEDGDIVIYNSIIDCAKAFGKDYATCVIGWMNDEYGYVKPEGYKFKSISEE